MQTFKAKNDAIIARIKRYIEKNGVDNPQSKITLKELFALRSIDHGSYEDIILAFEYGLAKGAQIAKKRRETA